MPLLSSFRSSFSSRDWNFTLCCWPYHPALIDLTLSLLPALSPSSSLLQRNSAAGLFNIPCASVQPGQSELTLQINHRQKECRGAFVPRGEPPTKRLWPGRTVGDLRKQGEREEKRAKGPSLSERMTVVKQRCSRQPTAALDGRCQPNLSAA